MLGFIVVVYFLFVDHSWNKFDVCFGLIDDCFFFFRFIFVFVLICNGTFFFFFCGMHSLVEGVTGL